MSTRFTRSCPSFAFHDEERDIKIRQNFCRGVPKSAKVLLGAIFSQRFKKDEAEAIGNLEKESLQFSKTI